MPERTPIDFALFTRVMPAAKSEFQRPLPVAATAGVRMGCAPGGGRRPADGYPSPPAPYPATVGARGHFTGMPTRGLHARGAVAAGDNVRVPGLGAITRFTQPDAAPLAPAARRPSPRPPECAIPIPNLRELEMKL